MSVIYRGQTHDLADHRVIVESELDSALGYDNAVMVSLLKEQPDLARLVAWGTDANGRPRRVRIRLTEDDIRNWSEGLSRIADEMGKRAAEKR